MTSSHPSAPTIASLNAFTRLSESSQARLARGVRYVQCGKGASILAKGQRVSGAYVVLRGQLRVFTLSPDGNEATLYVIDPHETCVLALNCIFNDLLYPAWVAAAAPTTTVAVIPGTLFRTLFDAEPAIRDMTVQGFSTVVFRLMGELEGIHSYKLERRLSNFLLLRASADGIVRMTQHEIASHLGTTREVVARALGQLSAQAGKGWHWPRLEPFPARHSAFVSLVLCVDSAPLRRVGNRYRLQVHRNTPV